MVATLLNILAAFSKMAEKNKERTFIMVKPDGVQRGLVGEIMKRFESRGYKLVACKMCRVRLRVAIFIDYLDRNLQHVLLGEWM